MSRHASHGAPRPRPRRPAGLTAPPRLALTLSLAAFVAGCGDRLENIGKAPEFTAPGEAQQPAPPVTAHRVALATPPPAPAPEGYAVASLWRSGPESLFGDRRARTQGDILTVVIEIDDQAQIDNATERNRSNSEDMSVSALFGLPALIDDALGFSTDPSAGVGSSSSSSGDGSVQRSEKITLRIAATVVDVLPNGHMVVAGNQEVRVNYELRDLQVAGIVRPNDISRKNEITYDKMAEARIAYGGRGQITDVQQPRYGQQVLDVILPF
ncbi:MAG: flagellar basal body L-ring protein FlgH [Pseudomonadota bacterium]|nr:flagellar basal body L-ring protein FlgH [Pseudomonadota bacterium]MEE3098545.1 flagellar basal body L-ring protein FlgH [Pseudomonadota bacterium]